MLITRTLNSFENKPVLFNLKNLEFYTEDCSLDKIVNYALNGHIFTYNFKDSFFVRKDHYMSENYLSTQFIIVDVDHSCFNAEEIITRMKFKPTFWHTSYSHKKNGENKYHFYICFKEPICGENNFRTAYNMVIEGIEDLADKRCSDCHRIFYTSNCNYPDHEYDCTGIMHDVPEECTKPCNIPLTKAQKSTNTHIKAGEASLSRDFWNDFNTMGRGDFLMKHLPQYPFYYETQIDFRGKSYCNLSNTEYYIVNPLRYKFDKDKRKMVKNIVKIGERHGQLFKDAIQFRAVNPNITLEGLVIAIVHDVLNFYDNSDGEMSNTAIFSMAKDIMVNPHSPIKSNKKMKVNMAYFNDDSMSVQQKVGQARKDHTDDRIAEAIENNGLKPMITSIEDVISALRENSIHITKKRLLQFCDRYDMSFPSKKELEHRQVLFFHYQNPNLSTRQLEDLCKSKGIEISYKTIQTIIKNDNNVLRKYYYSDLQIPLGLKYYPTDFKLEKCNYITDTQELLSHIYAA
jgi:hypothetical protein